jgi:cell division protein FtsB
MPSKPPPSDADPEAVEETGPPAAPDSGAAPVSLAGLGIAGLSRRRVGWAAVALVTGWILVSFAGQASEAARAAERAAQEQSTNQALVARVAALRDELSLVQTQEWILQQARAYGLGTRSERPFAIAADAPPIPADAPGSPARRLGSAVERRSPLDVWLDALFGSGSGTAN